MTHSTESAVAAITGIAEAHGRGLTVAHDIGADQTTRRTAADPFAVFDPDGSLPHEAYVEIDGSPAVIVHLYPAPDDDATVTVDGVEFPDVPRDSVPAFLRSVYGGLASVKGRFFPPGQWLVVPLPGDAVYKEPITSLTLTPWLARSIRP
ncbi:hypothetical protein [Streptomyces sp. MUM 178J]|uniref:hypothetical protein n=1 Tax=Streptomyces sp. MUM 178J TaxID=2791991 RepID=UPI001F03D241|nr:hypothetical protein [Streptomyces sp. MUM 178J]WRQ82708.1 hypothetical protein I3F59_027025 [Streptomyces sp. MUM 178J]